MCYVPPHNSGVARCSSIYQFHISSLGLPQISGVRFMSCNKLPVLGLKDFVFIDYEDIQSCQRAIEAMNNNPFDSFSSGPMKVPNL
jgi:hypothetical protein